MKRETRNLVREFGPFLRLLLPHRRPMLLGTILGTSAVAASIGLMALAGWFLSATALAGATAASAAMFNFFFPSIGVRLFAFVRTGARYAERLATHNATFRILAGLRVWFYRSIEPLSPACLMRHRSGDLLNRLVEDIDTLDNLYLRVLSPTAVAMAIALMLLVFLGFFDMFIALAGFGVLLVAGLAVAVASGLAGAETGRNLGRHTARLRVRIVEGLQGLGELLIFGIQRRHTENTHGEMRALISCQRRMNHLSALSEAVITLLSGTALAAVLYLGVGRVTSGGLNGAGLALTALAVLAAFEAVYPLPRAYQYLGRSREAGRRLREIVEMEPAVSFPKQAVGAPHRFDVTFENVGFRYADSTPWVIRGVDFHIPAGCRAAVVGETGAGKSTLVNLMVRFWDPVEGRVLIGGQDVRCLTETDLRRSVTAVSQRAHIFGATIRENLLLARPGADDAALRRALERACLMRFVDSLPEGMDTWVGESGTLLSGGEARRLAVARCFLKNGPVWILDEPTEGLDPATEKELLTAIFEKTEGKTLLLITHRFVERLDMDHVFVLKAGRIAEKQMTEGRGQHLNTEL